jgi:hypothetical protein
MAPEKAALVQEQLAAAGIPQRHRLVTVDAAATFTALDELGLKVSTMGRGRDAEPEFFLAAGAAGLVAAEMVFENL